MVFHEAIRVPNEHVIVALLSKQVILSEKNNSKLDRTRLKVSETLGAVSTGMNCREGLVWTVQEHPLEQKNLILISLRTMPRRCVAMGS